MRLNVPRLESSEVTMSGNEPDIGELRLKLRQTFTGEAPPGDYPGDPFCRTCFEGKTWWEIEPEALCHYDSCQQYGTDAQRAYYFVGLVDIYLGVAAKALEGKVAAESSAALVWNYDARETGGLYVKTFRENYSRDEIALILECAEAVGGKIDVCEFIDIEEWEFFVDMLRRLLV